jgi:pyruvate dehydrogenase E1 component alpha subunit
MANEASERTAEGRSDFRAGGKGAAGVAEEEAPEASAAAGEADEEQPRRAEMLGDTDRETLLGLFRQMLLIRRFEEKAAECYALGKIGGFCHLYTGQEAVAVGAISAIRPDDYVISSYREHAHAIVKGVTPAAVMAELFGKSGGCSHGKGGSMHLFDAEVNFLGGHAIVGGQIPLATGVAFASKYRGTDQVTLCFLGDAAVNQGAFHESLNLAQLWKLPCVYICENNQYGMGTSVKRATSVQELWEKACSYDIVSEAVDGMDVLAVRDVTQRAVARARNRSLPMFIEARTYRYMGHSMSDPGKYRTRQEIEEYQKRDPIKSFIAILKEDELLTDQDIADTEKQIKEEVEAAVRFAEESPSPDASELFTDVYAGEELKN